MDQEFEQLFERADRLVEIVRRLSQENVRLRAQLAEVQSAEAALRNRMNEARERVELALSRLPSSPPADEEQLPVVNGQEH